MIVKDKSGSFEACPEYTGRAVCVDVTPLKKQESQFGPREVFRIVFEVDMPREDGTRFCVWSTGFTPSLNEKANLRKFLRGWMGRDLTKEELDGFDVESMLHKPAFLVVTHTTKDSETYANIASCTPFKGADPLKPSGKFIRAQDKPDKAQGNGGGNYKRVEQPYVGPETKPGTTTVPVDRDVQQTPPAAAESTEWASTKVHVGKFKGIELRDLSPEQIKPLIDVWMPNILKGGGKLLADDKRLIAALEAFVESRNKPEPVAVAEDDVPY